MTSGQTVGVEDACDHCGSPLRAHAPFCSVCGQAVLNRAVAPPPTSHRRSSPAAAAQSALTSQQPAVDQILLAGREIRFCSGVLDFATMLSPVVSLAAIAAVLEAPAVVYIVIPVAILAVWIWLQLWQGLTGMSVGKAVLGIRAIRSADQKPPGFAASATRSLIFGGTLGLAAVPVLTGPTPRGRHDEKTGIDLIDVTIGSNPLGPRQHSTLRRTFDRSLKSVQSPVPLSAASSSGGTR